MRDHDIDVKIHCYCLEGRVDDLRAERVALKAELEKLSCPHCGNDVNGTNWKSLALAAKEALERIKSRATRIMNGEIKTKAIGAADYDVQVCEEGLAAFPADGEKK